MTFIRIAIALILGLLVGRGSGSLAVWLEKREGLEKEEEEDRLAYEKEVEETIAMAKKKGEDPPESEEWVPEKYGLTALEQWASPICAGGIFAGLAISNVPLGELAIQLLWSAILVHISFFDFKHRLVLDVISYPAIVLGFALSFFTPYLTFLYSLAGAGFVGLFFFIPTLIKRGSIGLGDVKLAIFIGAITGFWVIPLQQGALTALFWGVALAAVVSLALLISRKVRLHDGIAYAPYLCCGAVIALFFAQHP